MSNEIIIDAFKEGDYPQGKFGAKELNEIQETYNPENYEAPILIGHLSDPSYKGKSAIPAFGWIGKVKVVGEHLKLVASQFSDELKGFIEKGLYKKVSAAFYEPTDPSNPTPGKWHLHHLAFLGGTPPQVKGLEGIQFSLVGSPIEMAEVDTEVSIDGNAIDTVEELGTEDTLKDITECFATCMNKIEEALTSDIDEDTKKTRCSLALSDCSSEIYSIVNMHWMFLDKLENVEEHQEAEMSEKKKWLVQFKELFTKRKESKDVDAKQQKEYEDKISALDTQIKEFQERDRVAKEAKEKTDAEALQAVEKVKAETLTADVKTFCDKAVEENRMTPAMREKDEPIMLSLGKTSPEVLKSFQEKYTNKIVPLGEVKVIDANQTKDTRPEVFVNAEQYVKDHPQEFSDIQDATQKTNRAIYLHSMGKIKFQGINKLKGAK